MKHPWRFFRAGGTDQVLIASADDLRHLRQLDQKRWVALACPTRGLEFDDRTLDLIDTDHDGRIRAPELIAACEWAAARLGDLGPLLRGEDRLRLASLADNEDGAALADEARRTLDGQGRTDAQEIDLATIAERQAHLAAERFNGDGLITLAEIDDERDRALATAIHDAIGGALDASGRAAIGEPQITSFFDQAGALLGWHGLGERDCGELRAAAVAVEAVHDKVEDFFARCRLADYDAAAIGPLNALEPEQLKAQAAQLLSLSSDALRRLPIAPVAPRAPLPLDERANPAWREALAALRELAVRPLLGEAADSDDTRLAESDWTAIKTRLRPCREWLAARPTGAVATLGVDAVLALLGPGREPDAAKATLMALVEQDRAAAPRHAALHALEKLLRLQRDLLRLARNFVSFEAFYRGEGAIFQAGTLFLDGRACALTVEVADPAKHAVVAGLAKAYLAYCDCTRTGEKKQIVAVVSAGDVDFLFIGRNGLFYDREGRDWDARIVKIIENPISVAQAAFSPYRKLLRLIEEQVAKRAAAGDSAAQGKLGNWAGRAATLDQTAAAPTTAAAAAATPAATPAVPGLPGLPPGRRVDVGTVAAIGVALGSISTVIVGVFGRFVELGWWIPVAILGILLSISGPSMLIAWLKLRQRSLGPILDASGWAINSRMRLSVKLGGSLTKRPRPVAQPENSLDPIRRLSGRRGAAMATAAVLGLAATATAAAFYWRMS